MEYDNSYAERRLAIMEVIKDYNAELDHALEKRNGKLPSFSIRDPSRAFITARKLHDFNEWCPVRDSPL